MKKIMMTAALLLPMMATANTPWVEFESGQTLTAAQLNKMQKDERTFFGANNDFERVVLNGAEMLGRTSSNAFWQIITPTGKFTWLYPSYDYRENAYYTNADCAGTPYFYAGSIQLAGITHDAVNDQVGKDNHNTIRTGYIDGSLHMADVSQLYGIYAKSYKGTDGTCRNSSRELLGYKAVLNDPAVTGIPNTAFSFRPVNGGANIKIVGTPE